MNKSFKTVEKGTIIEYDILLEFTSKDTNKKYVFYTDKKNNNIYISYYKVENDIYILTPIENQDEINMCKEILEEIKNNK